MSAVEKDHGKKKKSIMSGIINSGESVGPLIIKTQSKDKSNG